jgi:hypothetical protein
VPENLISTHFSVLEVGSQDFGTLLSGVDLVRDFGGLPRSCHESLRFFSESRVTLHSRSSLRSKTTASFTAIKRDLFTNIAK